MHYSYETEKHNLFTEDGMRMFLSIRDKVNKLIATAGAVRMQEAISGQSGIVWTLLACVDHMVAIGEIREVPQCEVAGQHRVFVAS